jgi:general secretion pathway protein K
MSRPSSEQGMILVNVLMIVALAASVLALMLSSEDGALQRSTRLREAARANALAHGGELSAISALRRDAAVAPQSDTLSEPWANIADAGVAIEGGTFEFVVGDAQARYNINALARGDILSRDVFARIVAAAGLAPEMGVTIAALLEFGGPVTDLAALRQAGIGDGDIAKLAVFLTALPEDAPVNVNTASEPLLAVLLANRSVARTLVARRERGGGLTSDDLAAARVILPPGTGFTSRYFWARGRVTIGHTSQQLVSLLQRRMAGERPEVIAIARWRGAAVPVQAPPLPP